MLELHINPDWESFVQRIEYDSKIISEDKEIILKTGESFDCVFRLKIGVPP